METLTWQDIQEVSEKQIKNTLKNEKTLADFTIASKSKFFKSYNCDFKNILILYYDEIYSLIYSYDMNCLAILPNCDIEKDGSYLSFMAGNIGTLLKIVCQDEKIKAWATDNEKYLSFSVEIFNLHDNNVNVMNVINYFMEKITSYYNTIKNHDDIMEIAISRRQKTKHLFE